MRLPRLLALAFAVSCGVVGVAVAEVSPVVLTPAARLTETPGAWLRQEYIREEIFTPRSLQSVPEESADVDLPAPAPAALFTTRVVLDASITANPALTNPTTNNTVREEFSRTLSTVSGTYTTSFTADGECTGDVLRPGMTWSPSGKLQSVTLANGDTVAYTYDGQGRRIRTQISSASGLITDRRTLWVGWTPVYETEYDGSGDLLHTRRYLWGPDLDGSSGGMGHVGGLLVVEYDGTPYAVSTDAGGNVIALIDSTGTIQASYEYGPFGEPRKATGAAAAACPFRWNTRAYDTETGLYYFGYRYYDAQRGRWLNREPLGESAALNLYAYCGGDPINYFDYLGLRPEWIDNTMSFFGEMGSQAKGMGVRFKDGAVEGYYAGQDYFTAGIAMHMLGDIPADLKFESQLFNGPTGTLVNIAPGVDFSTNIGNGTARAGLNTITLGRFSAAEGLYDLANGDYQQAQDSLLVGSVAFAGPKVVKVATPIVQSVESKISSIVKLRLPSATAAVERVMTLNASEIRFSQSSVKPALAEYVETMRKGGWFGDPIDAVRMSDGGLTSIDNTRLAAASITNTPVQVIIREGRAAFPAARGPQFFGGAATWEEAALNRINNPGNHLLWRDLYPNGSPFTGIRQGTPPIQ